MFVWILILGCWVALLLLILHDATKADRDGSAISNAAGNLKALAYEAMQKGASEREKVATAVEAASSSSDSIQQSGATANRQASAPPPKKKWWRKESHRPAMTAPELELAIADAVKTAAPGCEDFIGVIVQHMTPKSHLDPNWDVRGVKFGKADRRKADEALVSVVERLRQEFVLSDD
jgi:hypothetical protein